MAKAMTSSHYWCLARSSNGVSLEFSTWLKERLSNPKGRTIKLVTTSWRMMLMMLQHLETNSISQGRKAMKNLHRDGDVHIKVEKEIHGASRVFYITTLC